MGLVGGDRARARAPPRRARPASPTRSCRTRAPALVGSGGSSRARAPARRRRAPAAARAARPGACGGTGAQKPRLTRLGSGGGLRLRLGLRLGRDGLGAPAPARSTTASGSGAALDGVSTVRTTRVPHPEGSSRTVPLARSASHSTRDSGSTCVIRISPNSPRWRASEPSSDSSAHSSGGDLTRVREAWSDVMGDRFAVPRTLPPDLARRLLVGAQRLGGPEREAAHRSTSVVRLVGGLQAQDAPAAALGVRARLPGATASAVGHARFEERSVARTWCMRGTLHLVPAEDARWLVALLGPVGLARGRAAGSGLGVGPEATAAVRRGAGGRPAHPPRGRRRSARRRPPARRPPAGAHPPRDERRGARASDRGRRARARADLCADRRLARRPARSPTATPRSPSSPAATPAPTRRRPGGLRGLVGPADARRPPRPTPRSRRSSRRSRSSAAGLVPRGLEPAPPHVRLLPAVRRHPARPPRPRAHRPPRARPRVLPGRRHPAPDRARGRARRGHLALRARARRTSRPSTAPGPDVAAEVADVVRFRAG